MGAGIVVPLIVLPLAAIGVLVWYRRHVASLHDTDDGHVLSGVRLTGEALHRLPTPTWRVVHETADHLDGIDHVVVGPPGVVAVTTVLGDRPTPQALAEAAGGDARLVAAAAVARGGVDDLARRADGRCDVWARVYWGAPDPDRPPAEQLATGSMLVEGQRLQEWLSVLAAGPMRLSETEVTALWREITVGVGRPDPTA